MDRTDRLFSKAPILLIATMLSAVLILIVPAGASGSPSNILTEADRLIAAAQYEQAIRYLDENGKPPSPDMLLRRGTANSMLERFDAAKADLESARAASPNDSRIVFNLALVYYREGNLDKSRELIGQTLAGTPWFPEAHYHLALIAMKQGQKDVAMNECVEELNHNPLCAKAWDLHLKLKNGDSGREHSRPPWLTAVFGMLLAASAALVVFVTWKSK